MVDSRVRLRIDCSVSGDLTLVEVPDRGFGKDVREKGLFLNSDKADFLEHVYRKIKVLLDDGVAVALKSYPDDSPPPDHIRTKATVVRVDNQSDS